MTKEILNRFKNEFLKRLKMKILLFGGRGWLGSFLISIFEEKKLNYILAESRADNVNDVRNEIEKVCPTHIVSCLGRTYGGNYTTIDYLEDNLLENIRDNLYAPLVLALECKERKIHFTYIGTGCIFEYGEKYSLENGPTEKDDANFFGSAYSTVKGFTDKILRNYFENECLNCRIRMPVSKTPHSRNFITKILKYTKVANVPNSVTVIEELFPLIVDMMEKNITGTFNLVNTGTIQHSQIIDAYTMITDPKHIVTYVKQEELGTKAGRSNIYLDNTKLRELYPHIKTAEESIMEILKTFPKIK